MTERRTVVLVGGRHHGKKATLDLPTYTNVGGYSQPNIVVDGEPYLIELMHLRDGSMVRFLRAPEMTVRSAADALMSLTLQASEQLPKILHDWQLS